jgi:hypothetical protein
MRDMRTIAATAVTLNASSRRRKTANIITVATGNGPFNRGMSLTCVRQTAAQACINYTKSSLLNSHRRPYNARLSDTDTAAVCGPRPTAQALRYSGSHCSHRERSR